jgi:hypothetical protein
VVCEVGRVLRRDLGDAHRAWRVTSRVSVADEERYTEALGSLFTGQSSGIARVPDLVGEPAFSDGDERNPMRDRELQGSPSGTVPLTLGRPCSRQLTGASDAGPGRVLA